MRLSTLIILAFLITGCSLFRDGEPDNEQSIENLLPGNWEWIKTKCCLPEMNAITTPENCDCTQKLVFDEEKVTRYKDGSKSGEGSWRIRYGLGGGNSDNPFLTMDRGGTAMVTIRNDTLILDYTYMDLEKHYYVRDE